MQEKLRDERATQINFDKLNGLCDTSSGKWVNVDWLIICVKEIENLDFNLQISEKISRSCFIKLQKIFNNIVNFISILQNTLINFIAGI